MDTPLFILCSMSVGFTLLTLFVDEAYLAVICGIAGTVASFSASGYWLSVLTNIPGVCFLFMGLGLVCVLFSIIEGVMTWYPTILGIDPE